VENPALLKSVGLFAEFDTDELQKLSAMLVAAVFHPGDTILDEGNANRALHILKSGRIRVMRTVHGREVALCDLSAGQTFGELSVIEDGVASASLKAVSDAEVLSISIGDLARFFKESPSAGAKFWRAIAVELRRRLIQTNDVVARYFEVNQALVENPTFREAYAMCLR
jgi:CRP/FNR family cyclic AMP-dependent transcriptional regulator